MSKCTAVDACFCKGFRDVVRGIRLWKKKSRYSPKIGNRRNQKGAVFLEIRTLVSSPAAGDDQLQLTVHSLAPPPRVLGAVWCRTTMKIGFKWILSRSVAFHMIIKRKHFKGVTPNVADNRRRLSHVRGCCERRAVTSRDAHTVREHT